MSTIDNPTPASADIVPECETALIEAGKQMAAIQAAASGQEAVGVMSTGIFLRYIADSITLAAYENIKKSKAWKNYTDATGRNFSSLDEFCHARYGRSYRRMQELLADRNLIGEALFEQAEKLGLRQVDYNAIKALPAPRQELVKEALADGASLEDVRARIQQLAADTQHEIDKLEKEVTDLRAQADANERIFANKDSKLNELHRKLIRSAEIDWPLAFTGYSDQLENDVKKPLRAALAALETLQRDVHLAGRDENDYDNPMLTRARESFAADLAKVFDEATRRFVQVRTAYEQSLLIMTNVELSRVEGLME